MIMNMSCWRTLVSDVERGDRESHAMRMLCKGGAAMSLKPRPIQPVPAETARVAGAAVSTRWAAA